MFVIDVIPFARFAPVGALSYRFRENVPIGTIVSVPLRKKTVPGIVVACTSVRDAKESIKTAPFVLRSGTFSTTGILPVAYRNAFVYTAMHHMLPLGTILRALIPNTVLTYGFPKKLSRGTTSTSLFCEQPYLSRIKKYQDILTNISGTLLIIVPTVIEASRFSNVFSNAVVITGALTQKKLSSAMATIKDASVVITTPQYSFIPITKLEHVIIERESANSYLTIARNPIDTRVAIRALTKERCIPLTVGDYPLRIETRPIPNKALKKAPSAITKILDVRKKITGNSFKAIPKDARTAIESTIAKKGRVAILSVRKGYASTVICRDCGTSVRTKDGRPLSLATILGKRVFRSSNGDTLKSAKALCDKCGSWNLIPLGVGVERVAEDVRKLFPSAPLILFDTDTIRTPRIARETAKKFNTQGTIIVGTEALIPWLEPSQPLSLAVIASADSLLALPFWRARERLARLSFALTERAEKVIVVTRRPDDAVFTTIKNPLDDAFFAEEAMMRSRLDYPPYGHLITIRIEGTPAQIEQDTILVQSMFSPNTCVQLPDRLITQNKTVRTLVYKNSSTKRWPNIHIAQHITNLPPNIIVRVDPESFW